MSTVYLKVSTTRVLRHASAVAAYVLFMVFLLGLSGSACAVSLGRSMANSGDPSDAVCAAIAGLFILLAVFLLLPATVMVRSAWSAARLAGCEITVSAHAMRIASKGKVLVDGRPTALSRSRVGLDVRVDASGREVDIALPNAVLPKADVAEIVNVLGPP